MGVFFHITSTFALNILCKIILINQYRDSGIRLVVVVEAPQCAQICNKCKDYAGVFQNMFILWMQEMELVCLKYCVWIISCMTTYDMNQFVTFK